MFSEGSNTEVAQNELQKYFPPTKSEFLPEITHLEPNYEITLSKIILIQWIHIELYSVSNKIQDHSSSYYLLQSHHVEVIKVYIIKLSTFSIASNF